jgi:hypothetical protein
VNKNKNPKAHNIGVLYVTDPPYIVANQLNIFIPVGTAIIIVAAVKYARESTSIPTVNMWCEFPYFYDILYNKFAKNKTLI